MESFSVVVALRVMIRRPPVRDAEPYERFQEGEEGLRVQDAATKLESYLGK